MSVKYLCMYMSQPEFKMCTSRSRRRRRRRRFCIDLGTLHRSSSSLRHWAGKG